MLIVDQYRDFLIYNWLVLWGLQGIHWVWMPVKLQAGLVYGLSNITVVQLLSINKQLDPFWQLLELQ